MVISGVHSAGIISFMVGIFISSAVYAFLISSVVGISRVLRRKSPKTLDMLQ